MFGVKCLSFLTFTLWPLTVTARQKHMPFASSEASSDMMWIVNVIIVNGVTLNECVKGEMMKLSDEALNRRRSRDEASAAVCLSLYYLCFLSLSQMRMMLIGSSSYPFSSLESVLYKTLFVRPLNCSALSDPTQSSDKTGCASQNTNKANAFNGSTSTRQNTDQTHDKKTDWVPRERETLAAWGHKPF